MSVLVSIRCLAITTLVVLLYLQAVMGVTHLKGKKATHTATTTTAAAPSGAGDDPPPTGSDILPPGLPGTGQATHPAPMRPTNETVASSCRTCVSNTNTTSVYDFKNGNCLPASDGNNCTKAASSTSDCDDTFTKCVMCSASSQGKWCYDTLQCLLIGMSDDCENTALFPSGC